MRRPLVAAALAALAAAGCTMEEGPMMEPGSDCLSCHSGGEAPTWSFAGTIFEGPQAPESAGRMGVTVTVEGADGKRVSVRSNAAGNFYSAERLRPPLRAWVSLGGQVAEMQGTFEHGGCNACHTWPARPSYPELTRLTAP